MSVRRLVEIVLRLWALTLFVRLALSVPAVISMFAIAREAGDAAAMTRMSQIGNLAGLGLLAIIAALLFTFAPAIAARLVHETEDELPAVSAQQIAGIAIVLLAIYLLVEGAQNLVAAAYTLAAKPSWDETGTVQYLLERQQETVVRSAIQIVLGGLLLWKRQSFGNLAMR